MTAGKPVSNRPTVSELRKAAHDAVIYTPEPRMNAILTAIDALADRLEDTEHKVNVAKMLEAAQRVDIELRKKAEREVERRHDIADCKAAWDRLRAVIHAANCRCHAGKVRQCDEVKALQIDQDYPHLHPYIDPKCAILRGGDRE